MPEPSIASAPIPSATGLNRLSPQAVFLLVAGFFGLAMAFITPPVQAPDEPHHWYRVYQLSQGKMLADVIPFAPADAASLPPGARNFGGQIPASIVVYESNVYAAISYHPENKASAEQILDALKIPLNPQNCAVTSFPNTALYTILPYAPQTLGMLIARKLQWPALGLMYAGRVGTVLGYLLIGWWAIRITPILKWPACFILTSPMALFLAASLSADPLTTAVAFLATGLLLRCIFSPSPLTTGTIISLTLTLVALALCKPAYFPIGFLVLTISRKNWGAKWGKGWGRWALPLAIILLSIGAFAAWYAISGASHVKERGPGPQFQRDWMMHHKMAYLGVLRNTLVDHWSDVSDSAVSQLGWLDTKLLPGVVDFIFIALAWITLAYDEPVKLGYRPRLMAAFALVTSVLFIATANFMVWDDYREVLRVEGLQGRYFLPVALLLCMIFRRRGRYPVQPKWMLALLSAIATYTVWVMIERYYLPPGWFGNLLSGTAV